MVRLLHPTPKKSGRRSGRVSIPQWCDCCPMSRPLLLANEFQFQSHNGAIAAKGLNRRAQIHLSFQSHNGAIAAGRPADLLIIDERFNPTMVRLLLINLWHKHVGHDIVSIPQWCDCCLIISFIITLSPRHVSIPQWCDCCRSSVTTRTTNMSVSIPQWCDCCLDKFLSMSAMVSFQSHNGAIAAMGHRSRR